MIAIQRVSATRALALVCGVIAAFAAPAAAQLDQQLAAIYFKEAAALCEREGGRLWGVSLCGPMVIADPATKSIATNQQAPAVAQPPAIGFANAAMDWGGVRWSTFVWQLMPADQHARARMMMHELFHRIQPQLGFLTRDGQNDHLDTLDGRYWLQLEWRALARALGASGAERTAAVRDALAFRATRHRLFPDAAENERVEEIREGLAQYTGTVAAAASPAEAVADVIKQLAEYERNPTFVRTFAYPSGAAYGILLDDSSPGWTRQLKPADDLGQKLRSAARVQPADDVDAAAKRYGGVELRIAEEKRDAEQKVRIAELRRSFVEDPVLVLPGAPGSFRSVGVTPIPGAGTVYPDVRVTAEWGVLEAASALRSPDRSRLILTTPLKADGATLSGDGWTLKLAPGWVVRSGPRTGDFQVVRDPPPSGKLKSVSGAYRSDRLGILVTP